MLDSRVLQDLEVKQVRILETFFFILINYQFLLGSPGAPGIGVPGPAGERGPPGPQGMFYIFKKCHSFQCKLKISGIHGLRGAPGPQGPPGYCEFCNNNAAQSYQAAYARSGGTSKGP